MDSDRKYRPARLLRHQQHRPTAMARTATDREAETVRSPSPYRRHRAPPPAPGAGSGGVPLLQLRDDAAPRAPSSMGPAPNAPTAAALLQTVLSLRALHPISMQQARPGAHSGEGPSERMHAVLATRDRGTRSHVYSDAGTAAAHQHQYTTATQRQRRTGRLRPVV
jgi:hypothetical protein